MPEARLRLKPPGYVGTTTDGIGGNAGSYDEGRMYFFSYSCPFCFLVTNNCFLNINTTFNYNNGAQDDKKVPR
jgi:hypothetical protein